MAVVAALVGALPEELVDQVAVRAMQFDGVEAQALGVSGGPSEAVDGVGQILLAHGFAELLARRGQARGTVDRTGRFPVGHGIAHGPDVPELGRDLAASVVDRIDHLAPAVERLAVEVRDPGVVDRGRAVDPRALRQDQADLVLRPAAVVLHHIRAGLVIGREGPRHRGHDDPVGELERLVGERAEEGVGHRDWGFGIGDWRSESLALT
jgi:hypothetical protein